MRFRIPAVKAHVTWHRLGEEQVVLRVGDRDRLITGRIYGELLEAMDGATSDEIVDRLSASHPTEMVLFALHQLASSGFLEEAGATPEGAAAEDAYWSALGLEPASARERLASASVALRGLGVATSDCERAEQLLCNQGVRVADDGRLIVVLTGDYQHPALAEIDQRAGRDGREWLMARPGGATAWIGPHFRPGQSVCWHCLAARLREARWVDEAIRRRGTRSSRLAAPARLPSAAAGALSIIVGEVTKLLAGHPSPANTFTTLDTLSLTVAHHYVRAMPGCPVCGLAASPDHLRRQAEMLAALRGASEDVTTMGHLISPLVGLVDQLRDLEVAADGPACIVTALQPTTADFAARTGRFGPRDLAFGKGLRHAQAVISCIGEAVERYSTMHVDDRPTLTATRQELGEQAIEPAEFLGFSKRQYRLRTALNKVHGGFNWIPPPFNSSVPMAWTRVTSLQSDAVRLVPAAYCYFGVPRDAGGRFMRADSNGCASGSSLGDARRRALQELIERDAAAIWWYNRLVRPRVDLDSFANPVFEDFQDWARRAARSIWVLDISTDLAVPAFVAISARHKDGGCIAFGFGCHPDAARGTTHALVEMYQMTLLFEAGRCRTPGLSSDDAKTRAVQRWIADETLNRQRFMQPTGIMRRDDYPGSGREASRDGLAWLLDRLSAVGLEAFSLDLTRPDVGLPVARVIVSGLRHFWARLAPGRLYDVPCKLGWLTRAHRETDLNPIPLFI